MRRLINKLFYYIEMEDIRGLIRYCLILLPFVGGAIWVICSLIGYLAGHKEALIMLGIATCMIVPPMLSKKAPVQNTEGDNADDINTDIESSDDNLTFWDTILVRSLFVIFNEYAPQFHVIRPARHSDLQDTLPSGFDPGRNIVVYRFKVMSDRDAISSADFHEALTIHLEERLASGELPLGKPTAIWGGKAYPKIFIDECVCAGSVWHITLLICNDSMVADYIDRKRQALIRRSSRISRQYEDCDFR